MAQQHYRFSMTDLEVLSEAAAQARVATAQATTLAAQACQKAEEAASMALIAAETIDTLVTHILQVDPHRDQTEPFVTIGLTGTILPEHWEEHRKRTG
jgi:hypothetical protein